MNIQGIFNGRKEHRTKPKGKELRDEDIVFFRYYLAHNKEFEMGIDKIRNALIERAERKSYHPVKEYLKWVILGR